MTDLPPKTSLLAQFGGIPRVLERVVKGFLDAVPGHLTGIKQSLESGDGASLAAKAHSYKGSLGYFTKGVLYQDVIELEVLAKSDSLETAQQLYPRIEEKSLLLKAHLEKIIGDD